MSCYSYSQFFHTVHDEPKPVGKIGRGTHYSVLEAVQWLTPNLAPLPEPLVQRIAVIWDEDHDTRVINALEIAYMRNLSAPVVFIGERKGTVNLVLHPDFEKVNALLRKKFFDGWNHILQNGYLNDSFALDYCYSTTPGAGSIIHDNNAVVSTYLQNISNIWDLGTKRFSNLEMPPIDEALRQRIVNSTDIEKLIIRD